MRVRLKCAVLCGALVVMAPLLPVVRVQGQENLKERPYLRINMPAHTAPVCALVFTHDSTHLCSAGLDKVVHVWRVPGERQGNGISFQQDLHSEFLNRAQSIRWEIGPGSRGYIYALAAAPDRDVVAFGGLGYRGGTGEIIWADVQTGRFLRTEYGWHRQSIASLAFSADGQWLASSDLSGKAILWPADSLLAGFLLKEPDQQTVHFRPIAFSASNRIVVPAYESEQRTASGRSVKLWRLHVFDVMNARDRLRGKLDGDDLQPLTPSSVLPQDHYGEVTALAASRNGQEVASADSGRFLYLHDMDGPRGEAATRRFTMPAVVTAMAVSPDGRYLVAGTDEVRTGPLGPQSFVQVWDIAAGEMIRRRVLRSAVRACAISPGGDLFAYTTSEGQEIAVERLDAGGEFVATIPGGRPLTDVAFIDRDEPFRVRFKGEATNGDADAVNIFDPTDVELPRGDPVREAEGSTSEDRSDTGPWRLQVDGGGGRLRLSRSGRQVGEIELSPRHDGVYSSHCWVPDAKGEVAGVAIGTAIQNRILVFDLNTLALRRDFWGHQGRVLSLDASANGRYLASGSADGTLRYWSLEGWQQNRPVPRRWGAELGVREGKLFVTEISYAGPLYRHGLRKGDAVTEIRWPEGVRTRKADRPQEIYRSLSLLPPETQVVFETERDGRRRPAFQHVSAWMETLAVFVADHEWIAWTPSGYYACSAGGERLIGWQVNESQGREPSFYPAVRFSKTFYRPHLMSRLLAEGIGADPGSPTSQSQRIGDVRPPHIRIVEPTATHITVQEPFVEIIAEAASVNDLSIVSMQLFLDGRPAPEYRKSMNRERIRSRERWQVPLTPGTHRVTVRADNEFSHDLSEPVLVVYEPEKARRAVYLLAVGISSYSGSLALEYAHKDAADLADTFNAKAQGPYALVHSKLLLNEEATGAAIREGLDWMKQGMKLGDLGVVFFSGHGYRADAGEPTDAAADEFFLMPADGDTEHLAKTCISDDTLRAFCRDIGGRGNVLIIVDACHAGAMRLDGLARELATDDYRVTMIASSKGDETSIETPDLRNGVFSYALLEGLQGKADSFMGGNNLVESDEIGGYVVRRARLLADRHQHKQTPLYNQPGIEPFPVTKVQ